MTKVVSALIGGALGLSLAFCGEITRGDTRQFIKPPTAAAATVDVAAKETTAAIKTETQTKTREEVALDEDFQMWLINYSYDNNISPYLVMAICERESGCNPQAVGDAGKSLGLMQIQKRYHTDRMSELNVSDLTDAQGNIKVGIDYLLELFNKNNDVSWVLMAYNGGEAYADRMTASGTTSEYATEVLNRSAELESR